MGLCVITRCGDMAPCDDKITESLLQCRRDKKGRKRRSYRSCFYVTGTHAFPKATPYTLGM